MKSDIEYYRKWRAKNREKIRAYAREYGKIYRKKNPSKFKIKDNKANLAKYGLTIDEYNQKAQTQNNCCAICKKSETAKQNGVIQRLAVDHCHRTGKVRDLLCGKCNVAIGHLQDEPKLLEYAAEYIRRHTNDSK